MIKDDEIVFCPYQYLIDPVIRGSLDLDLKGSVVQQHSIT
jgi:Fanconi anemia group J protein